MTVALRPLSPALGVEVTGIDLHEDQPPTVRQQVVDAWRRHHLVLVRGQAIDLDEQRRFVQWFGDAQDEMYISNTRPTGVARAGSLLLHQDHCFLEVPLPAICLYAEAVPASGGETVFANGMLAYQRLPSEWQRRIAQLRALHIYDADNDYGNHRFRVATAGPNAPRAVHPVVLPHPDSGRPILYVNRLMTDSIVGLDPAESEELLDQLVGCLDDTDIQYLHRWQPHDVVIWDNLALQHGRRDFPPEQRRSLRRLTVVS